MINNIKLKTLFVSFLIALFLWFYVKLSNTYIYQIDIPIVTLNIKEGRVIKNEMPKFATVKLQGKGSSLMRLLLLWKSDVKYLLDLDTINYGWDFYLNNYLNWVKFPSGYEKISIMEIVAPDMISIELDKKIEKKFPISAESIKVQIPEHYVQVGKIRFEPDSVTVSGPESKIIKMQSIPTELKEYKNKKKQFSDNIYINKIDKNVLIYDVSRVKLFVDIQIIGEKVLEDVNIKVINVPVGYSVKVEPATVNLKIKGGINYVNEIKKEDISVEIPWNKEWKKYRAYTEKLIIRHPNDVISYEETPKTFTVIVG